MKPSKTCYLPLQLYPWQDLLLEASDIAHTTYRSVYDCLYLVLVRQLEGTVVTVGQENEFFGKLV